MVLIDQLMEDERLGFASEPALVNTVLPRLLEYSVPTGNLVGSAYLAAFSIAASLRLAMLDRRFVQFRGLELELLSA